MINQRIMDAVYNAAANMHSDMNDDCWLILPNGKYITSDSEANYLFYDLFDAVAEEYKQANPHFVERDSVTEEWNGWELASDMGMVLCSNQNGYITFFGKDITQSQLSTLMVFNPHIRHTFTVWYERYGTYKEFKPGQEQQMFDDIANHYDLSIGDRLLGNILKWS